MYTTMLELAISMVFLFLMLSAASSAIQEIIANLWRWRAKTLEEGIKSLLQSEAVKNELYKLPLLQGLFSPKVGGQPTYKPSYIPSSTFALAVLNWAEKNGTKFDGGPAPEKKKNDGASPASGSPPTDEGKASPTTNDEYKETKELLQSLLRGAVNVETQKKRLEDWFDNSMDRISGWYKRKSHAFLWIIGGALCLLVNADTISLSKAFWNDQALRAATVTAATEHVKNAPKEERTAQSANSTTQPSSGGTAAGTSNDTAFKRLNDVRAELSKVNIPLGWCWNGDEGELKKKCFPIFNDSVRVTAKGKSGTKTYAYWIVSNYADGKSSLAGPFTLESAPDKLSTENHVVISWPTEAGAKSYDVLRTSTSKPPKGKCDCAVATTVSGLTADDKSESLHPYKFAAWTEEQTSDKPVTTISGKHGKKTYAYWIIVNYPDGKSIPSAPTIVTDAPDILSDNDYVVITWQEVKGAKSYDVLRTSDKTLPSGQCECAVVTNTSDFTARDQTISPQSYSLARIPATATVTGRCGTKTNYYWIVATAESGTNNLDGPFPSPNSPDTLSDKNYVVISWQGVQSAKSYDVLRTSDTKLPTANCNCAVATAVPKPPVSDKSVTLQPYQLTVARVQDAALPDPRLVISSATCGETLAWVWWKLVGLAMTALAISQGAPFWFDLLQKAVNLRLAGDAPDEKQEKK